jgi:hypothetical protein
MPNRIATIRAAERTTRGLRVLVGRLGTKEHPRGRVMSAYRNAHRALRDVFRRTRGPWALGEAREVLEALRRDVLGAATEALDGAVALGLAQAEVEREVWELGPLGMETPDTAAMSDGWIATVDEQAAYALSVIATEGDPVLILGDDDRTGRLRYSDTTRMGAQWVTTAAMQALWMALGPPQESSGMTWDKQVIATIDERTTDCCLQAQGQIVPYDSDFKLTGTPRYADELPWTPFHDYCRTSVAQLPSTLPEDSLTREMRAAARAELQARKETGILVEIHPSHARSRRG